MAATMAAIMEITENIMRRMHEPSTKLHNALYFMSGMMVVILALVIVAGVKTKAENAGFHIADDTENSYEQQVAGQTDTTQDSGQEKWQEGVVAYQGKEYLYNTDIKTYLMMGVDIDGPVQQSSDYTQGGQSDALFLLVVNNKTEQLQVISINRNTMADIELEKAGKELKEEYIFPGAWEVKDGVSAYERYKQLKEKPTAIFAMNDLMAVGFMDAALNDGVRIPEDVSVIGFDNRQECRFTRPRLTTVDIPLEKMGEKAGQILLRLISGQISDEKKVVLPCEFLERDSVTYNE